MTPAAFIKGFTYRKGTVFDGIRLTGTGDCDDFAWSLLCVMEGGEIAALKALLKGKAKLWRVRSPVNKTFARHVALWHQGRPGDGRSWIDSTNRRWRETPDPHDPVRRMRLVTLLPLLAWGTLPGKIVFLGAVTLPILRAMGVI